jgi:hypothetical protein
MSTSEIEEFLAEPVTAVLATNGPTIRPVWYQWDGRAFWMISGPWSKLMARVAVDPDVALCAAASDFRVGRVLQVCAYGPITVHPYDVDLARRMMYRYLGPDENSWSQAPDDHRQYVRDAGPAGARLLRLEPRRLVGLNFSYAQARTER